MALTAGTRIGPYEIKAPLGEGGMGVVYRASDTKLRRDVAIKMLPDHFADNSERLSWFQREAQVLAALNHPNIAQVYGLEESADSRCIVMELVEGETLADRLKRGPIAPNDALPIALQIATALEAAHEKSIIHRDLKPANIKLTPDGAVKVLDFGLAKAFEDTSQPDLSNSPTLSMAATNAGVIIGTAGYMSPEQAAGKPADKRSDIWSFGVVLFEMLTGRRLFEGGETVSHTLADVLRAPIDLERLPASTPAAMQRLIARCLDRNVKNRLRDIGEARIALETAGDTPETSPAGKPARGRSFAWSLAAAVCAVLAAFAGFGWWRATRPVDRPLMRLSDDPGDGLYLNAAQGPAIAISPDGLRIAYVSGASGGQTHLSVRLIGSSKASVLSGADGALAPFFSPDGRSLAFFSGSKLKKISIEGGAAVTLYDMGSANPRGGYWGEDGNIFFSAQQTPLMRVSSNGGTATPATEIDKAKGEVSNRYGQLLPGGAAFLFSASKDNNVWEDATIEVQSVKTGQRKMLVAGGYFGRYISSSDGSGYLLYVHEGTVFAAPMDAQRLELTGSASPVLEDVAGRDNNGFVQLDVTANGTLIYVAGGGENRSLLTLGFLDSKLEEQPLAAAPAAYYSVRPSHGGKQVAARIRPGSGGNNLYVYDLPSNRLTQLTFVKASLENFLTWTPDDKHIAFYLSSNELAGPGIYWIRTDGAGEPQRILEGQFNEPYSFSPDGQRLAYARANVSRDFGIWTLPLDLSDPDHPKPGKPELFLGAKAAIVNPAISPDGNWIAYSSQETQPPEIFVRPFAGGAPASGGKWQISSGGGIRPEWSSTGSELRYSKTGPFPVPYFVTYSTHDNTFAASQPKSWAQTEKGMTAPIAVPMPDGKHLIATLQSSDTTPQHNQVTFLLNFDDEIRRRLTAGK